MSLEASSETSAPEVEGLEASIFPPAALLVSNSYLDVRRVQT